MPGESCSVSCRQMDRWTDRHDEAKIVTSCSCLVNVFEPDGQCMYDMILRCIGATVIAVEKQ